MTDTLQESLHNAQARLALGDWMAQAEIDAINATMAQAEIDATPQGQARIAANKARYEDELTRAANYVEPTTCDICGDDLDDDSECPSCEGE